MDRFAAMLMLLGGLVSMVLLLLALFAVAPIICSCLVSLLYSLYLFMAYEESGVHHAQEFENRFWTIFALLLSTALFFAKDSPLAFGLWSPSLGLLSVLLSGYAMHIWDRHLHRLAISQSGGHHLLRRNRGGDGSGTSQSLLRLQDLGIPVSAQLEKINECLTEIDQLLIPSTINNLINQRFVLSKEREIIKIIEECDARALNYLISHVKLGLLFYKIKDHRSFNGKNRTELINLLAIERLQILTVMSRVILLHSLQLLKLRANPRAEFWVQNILLHTHRDDLSELKTLMDAKGDYFSMNKLLYDDIRSESIRQTILNHIRREAAVQQTYMQMGHMRRRAGKNPVQMLRRKVLSDVDDTLCSSGGRYPAGVDKRYSKKTVYPGVLAFYRELDLGTEGPDEWEDELVGNLVFLSARPHVYRDMSEKHNFAKFELLRANTQDGRKGMHTMPSLLAGDLSSGSQYVMTNDFEPLAQKKYDNFRRYVSVYPEYKHLFVCDNGQGDVRAAEVMFDNFPYEFETVYVHVVQNVQDTYGYAPKRWRQKEFQPCFFRTYPEAALHAASRNPPLIRIKGLQRICQDAVKDFVQLKRTQFASESSREERRLELNQSIWRANEFLIWRMEEPVELIKAEQYWSDGEKVRTPYGIATVRAFDPVYNLYDVELDWRPLDVQVLEHAEEMRTLSAAFQSPKSVKKTPSGRPLALPTVVETDDEEMAANIPEHSNRDHEQARAVQTAEEGPYGTGGEQEVGESSAECRDRRPPSQPDDLVPELLADAATVSTSNATVVQVDVGNTGASVLVQEDTSEASSSRSVLAHNAPKFVVRAQVSGRFVTKYTPPILPALDVKKKSNLIFPFLSKTPEGSKTTEPKTPLFKPGDQVTTPYGLAEVVQQREEEKMIVVEIIGWKGTAYLRAECVKKISKSLIRSIFRQLSGVESTQKALEFPYAKGTPIRTPFGEATVIRPVHVPTKASQFAPTATIGLQIHSWKLANETHPVIYCTVANAQSWKDRKQGDSSAILSTLNTLVTSSRSLLGPFLSQKKYPSQRKLFKRYYKDAAAVTTKYGDGRIKCFRESDGFYEVTLVHWTLANGNHAKAFLRSEDISYRIAKGCQEGRPVLTTLGMSGTLASVEPTSGVHIVTVHGAGMVCYLQPESIVCPLKATVGEEVLTPYGEGKVTDYSVVKDMYTIKLSWDATMYAKGDAFDRICDGVQDGNPSISDWLFRFLFFGGGGDASTTARSRSNSVASATQSTRSLT